MADTWTVVLTGGSRVWTKPGDMGFYLDVAASLYAVATTAALTTDTLCTTYTVISVVGECMNVRAWQETTGGGLGPVFDAFAAADHSVGTTLEVDN